ncbi:similar to Saccharomyces cerevisiae YDR363W-A SEM1 Component of the lid subcomplex of the regulatory subunit of the 26S proteasome [Maudiozyma barnettii]|uniref:26S proteasome complex subunit SEM1 n=1 Tax=Maudiozyma barnettii TaxID=61262 RepID=A0A8H2VDV4_9SACH|nr:proteasome regulatory particle lid subunit SEM1 [Kazachstania barnettii]CAB4253760.1 similar to Saccharomyces cerevisiae YDR363W-A SEM1 Component of the lid subcomplex of the regulatory subunit of the 26S proteasome [Kazachstania barnettii]CAD1781508.1 similar to Saccharomyces cerevisiae YDR363W-A SEM1 Component of the lid subcomplex of the regulatory subunit of the 26S proteasome [Kazachstania barnettii]
MSSTTDKPSTTAKEQITTTEKPVNQNKKTLEEDDEFEDFLVDQWPASTTLKDSKEFHTNLWEESWDDVEVDDNFTNDLRAEIAKYKQEHQ